MGTNKGKENTSELLEKFLTQIFYLLKLDITTIFIYANI